MFPKYYQHTFLGREIENYPLFILSTLLSYSCVICLFISGNAEKETQLKHHTVYLSTMAAVSFLKNAAICRLFNKALLCNLRKQHVAFVLRNYSKILSIEESGSRCGYCLTHHRRTVHMSAGLYVKPKVSRFIISILFVTKCI